MNSELLDLYNINLIDLDYLFDNKIDTDISNFIFDNSLKLSLNNKDFKAIVNHYTIDSIITSLKEDKSNIILFRNCLKCDSIKNFFDETEFKEKFNDILGIICRKFKFKLYSAGSDFDLNRNNINSLRNFSSSKIDFQKLSKFIKDNNLSEIENRLKNNQKLKFIISR